MMKRIPTAADMVLWWKHVVITNKADDTYVSDDNAKEEEEESKFQWHRYLDILIPLVTIPLLIVIGVALHHHITVGNHGQGLRWNILILGVILLVVSFTVFCYICNRLNAIMGKKRCKVHIGFPAKFSGMKSNPSLLKSVNSDLQLLIPLGNQQHNNYNAIKCVPPSYTISTDSKGCNYITV